MITDLAQLIRLIESNDNPHALRFEPAHHPAPHLVTQMQSIAACSFATAQVLCAISWGAYQIMGDELIALGLNVDPMAYCLNQAMQDIFFEKYMLADHLTLTLDDVINNASKRALFVRLWNGPGNVDAYSARLLAVYQAHGGAA